MEKLKVLDLFSGIGGFSLGLERTGGFETVAFCEIESFCRRVLAKHWPNVPCYEDVRTLTAERLAADGIAVDVICGGFPCQPFSTASRGRRVAADFWPEMERLINELRPSIVIAENVAELPIRRSAYQLREVGYKTIHRRIGAYEIGADHERSRWWLCAYTNNQGELHGSLNAEVARMSTLRDSVWGAENYARAIRVSDGLSNRTHRLRALGNAVVPQIPELIGRAILKSLEDVKSAFTRKDPVYRLKNKLMKACHGIDIREV